VGPVAIKPLNTLPIDSKYMLFVAFFSDQRPVYSSKLQFMSGIVQTYFDNSASEPRSTLRDLKSLVQLTILQRALKIERVVLDMIKIRFPRFYHEAFKSGLDLSLVDPEFRADLHDICETRKVSFTLSWPVIDYVTVVFPLLIQMVSLFSFLFLLLCSLFI